MKLQGKAPITVKWGGIDFVEQSQQPRPRSLSDNPPPSSKPGTSSSIGASSSTSAATSAMMRGTGGAFAVAPLPKTPTKKACECARAEEMHED